MKTISTNNRCYCGQINHNLLFTADEKHIVRCFDCSQVRSLEKQQGQEFYDENYFVERNDYIEQRPDLVRNFQTIFNKMRQFAVHGRLLDVGCGVGILLDVAKNNGFTVSGVEISPWASEYARQKGLDVVTGGLIDAKYPDKSFDIVVMNHVLEHIASPVEILDEVNRLLIDDGLFVIGVPNYGSFMAKIMRGKWMSLMPEQHIWQFTHESLGNLLKQTGFSEVYFESKDNHKIVGWRPIKMLHRLVNFVATTTNNSEAMLVFCRKVRND